MLVFKDPVLKAFKSLSNVHSPTLMGDGI